MPVETRVQVVVMPPAAVVEAHLNCCNTIWQDESALMLQCKLKEVHRSLQDELLSPVPLLLLLLRLLLLLPLLATAVAYCQVVLLGEPTDSKGLPCIDCQLRVLPLGLCFLMTTDVLPLAKQ